METEYCLCTTTAVPAIKSINTARFVTIREDLTQGKLYDGAGSMKEWYAYCVSNYTVFSFVNSMLQILKIFIRYKYPDRNLKVLNGTKSKYLNKLTVPDVS
jgi:hypothetical protein